MKPGLHWHVKRDLSLTQVWFLPHDGLHVFGLIQALPCFLKPGLHWHSTPPLELTHCSLAPHVFAPVAHSSMSSHPVVLLL